MIGQKGPSMRWIVGVRGRRGMVGVLVAASVLALGGLATATTGTTSPAPTYLAPMNIAQANLLQVGRNGVVIAAGNALSDYQPTPGAYDVGPIGGIGLQAIDPTGSVLWKARIGAAGADYVQRMAIDDNGDVYLAGLTRQSTWPTTDGALGQHYWYGSRVTYLMKLSSNGRLLWSARIPGADDPTGLDVGADGSVYVTGTANNGMTATPGAFDSDHVDGYPNDPSTYPTDGFVDKISPAGTRLEWSTFIGGSKDEIPAGVKLAPNGNVLVAGTTWSTDFPTTPGALNPTYPSGADHADFLTELAPDARSATFSTYVPDGVADWSAGLLLGSGGRIGLYGVTDASDSGNVVGQLAKGGWIDQFSADGSVMTRKPTVLFDLPNATPQGQLVVIGRIVGAPAPDEAVVRVDFDGNVVSTTRLAAEAWAVAGDGGSTYVSLGMLQPGDPGTRTTATRVPHSVARYTRCTIRGTSHNDVLRGTPHADVICGYGGNDRIYGMGGADVLIGGAGRDTLYGGPGIDILRGGRGNDTLYGGLSRDLLIGGPGTDHCVDHRGRNTFRSCP